MDKRTRDLIRRLAFIFEARYQEETRTTNFLDGFGRELSVLDSDIAYLHASMRLPTMPVEQVFRVWRAIFP